MVRLVDELALGANVRKDVRVPTFAPSELRWAGESLPGHHLRVNFINKYGEACAELVEAFESSLWHHSIAQRQSFAWCGVPHGKPFHGMSIIVCPHF